MFVMQDSFVVVALVIVLLLSQKLSCGLRLTLQRDITLYCTLN